MDRRGKVPRHFDDAICTVCGKLFCRQSARRRCQNCTLEIKRGRDRTYAAQHRAEARDRAARWLIDNRERSRAAKRDAYHADLDGSRAKDKARYAATAERKKASAKRWYDANREALLVKNKTPDGRAAARQREAQKRKSPTYRLHSAVSSALRSSLRQQKGGRKWEALVGYSLAQLVAHLERQFVPGMSWANYGKWHVDHILPRVSFAFTSPDDPEFRACWALSNLQPLWAEDNIRKHAKIITLV